MRVSNLFIRIFASFWLIIIATMIFAAFAGYFYHTRMEEVYSNFEIDETVIRAGEILDTQGYSGLKIWLKNIDNRDQYPLRIFLLDDERKDILGRRIPRRIINWQNHFELPHHRSKGKATAEAIKRYDQMGVLLTEGDNQTDELKRQMLKEGGINEFRQIPSLPSNLRPANTIPFLIGPDNKNYRLFFFPKNSSLKGTFDDNLFLVILLCGLLLSLVVSYLLSRAITNPIKHFREAASSVAKGDFLSQVSDSVSNRKDEIGSLARDINRMSNKLYQYQAHAEELLRNISHELRSPLSRMSVSLDIVQQRDMTEKIEHVRIKKEINLLNKLIGSILEYSIVGNAKKESEKLINLAVLASEVRENINFEYKNNIKHNIEITLDVESDVTFFGYESQLKSALENILRNAMKYGPNNSQILFNVNENEHAIQISIIDEGTGVSQSDTEKIFEPFHRTMQANIEKEEGSGLGLAIAKEAIELNKGSIKAVTTDKNFTVNITLPKKYD